jgi:hypothetical protein
MGTWRRQGGVKNLIAYHLEEVTLLNTLVQLLLQVVDADRIAPRDKELFVDFALAVVLEKGRWVQRRMMEFLLRPCPLKAVCCR